MQLERAQPNGDHAGGDDAVLDVLKRGLLDGPDEFDEAALCAATGVDAETARRLWRAMGFVDAPPDVPAFTQADRKALALVGLAVAQAVDGQHYRTDERLVQTTRVLSSLLARAADVVAEGVQPELEALRGTGLSDAEMASIAVARLKLVDVSAMLDYLFRRQLVTALARQITTERVDDAGETAPEMAVVFADLVGYTALSQQLDDDDLARLVTRFQGLAYDLVGANGGRVIKTLGDEVMVVCDDVRSAVVIGLKLVDVYKGETLVPDVRVGIACGPVLGLQGDYFGSTVNLASRLAGVARPGTLLVSDDVHSALVDAEVGRWTRLRPRRVKGFGWTTAWRLSPAATSPEDARELVAAGHAVSGELSRG